MIIQSTKPLQYKSTRYALPDLINPNTHKANCDSKTIKKELKKALDDNRLQKQLFLQTQINPHTLFNALNTLAAYNELDQEKMIKCLQHLTEYFRGVLHFSEMYRATLREERSLMEHYLKFESLRLDDQLSVEWIWDEDIQQYLIPPLLFQPLIENAIKHGIGPYGQGQLRIITERTENGLRLATENNGAVFSPNKKSDRKGIGMRNLQDRLDLAYGENAAFRIWTDNGQTISEIVIKDPLVDSNGFYAIGNRISPPNFEN